MYLLWIYMWILSFWSISKRTSWLWDSAGMSAMAEKRLSWVLKSPLTWDDVERTKFSGWWFGCHQFYFPINIGNFIIPIDELIFFRGVAQPPTGRWCSFFFFNLWGYGGFLKWRYPKAGWFIRKIPLNWMIWGYPYFRKPPYNVIYVKRT